MTRIRSLVLVCTFLRVFPSSAIGLEPFTDGSPSESARPKSLEALLETSCLHCHDGEGAEGGLDLKSLSGDLADPNITQKWVRIYDRVTNREMPPPEDDSLSDAERQELLSVASAWITEFQRNHYLESGRVQGRRLTNLQLERTLQDLLAIDAPLSRLMPTEPRTNGYTGLADAQSMSHFQVETHLQVVDAALDIAFERLLEWNEPFAREYDPKGITASREGKQRNREPEMRDGLAVVWSSGLAFYGRITPSRVRESGWYRIKLTASAVKPPNTGGVWCSVRSGPCVSSAPQLDWIGSFEAVDEPMEHVFEAWIDEDEMLQIRPDDKTLKRARFQGGQVGAGEGEPQGVPAVALHQLSIDRIYPKGDRRAIAGRLLGTLPIRVDPKMGSLSLQQGCSHEDVVAQLKTFTERAFRRPVAESDFQPYVDMLEHEIRQGKDVLGALRATYRAVLCSPRFMYFVEPSTSACEASGRSGSGKAAAPEAESVSSGLLDSDSKLNSYGRELDSFGIANRLSYLFTTSMPDDELIELANQGKLRDASVLRQQVDRLLRGEGGRRFVKDFAAQWLDLMDIDFTEPDPRMYPDFDVIVQHAMLDETHQFLHSLIQDNAAIQQLVQADFTYLNSRLARYYGIRGVEGGSMQRVALDDDSVRGGVLSQGAILKVTADGTNTSPVLRGKWISERILGREIPPPPQNVPAVEPDIRGAVTIREQLQKHVSDDACAACHRLIDPPGYALENFDPSGRWRDHYSSGSKSREGSRLAIDPSFVMSDGRKFRDFREFRELVAQDPQSLARCFSEKLITYGTGAKISFADREPLERIVEQAGRDGYGMRSILYAVVTSPLFLSK